MAKIVKPYVELSEYVIIGGLTYTVETTDLRDDKTDGEIRYATSHIKLDSALLPQAKRVTLWHEILHALLTQAGCDDHSEVKISALAYGIVQVLRDNPWLATHPVVGDYARPDVSGS